MKNTDLGLLFIRLSIGILMMFHGIAKLHSGIGSIYAMLESKGLPGFISYGVYLGEIVAPILIIIGFRTRLAAIAFTINMLVIMFVARGDQLTGFSGHGGWYLELPALYLFGSLALIFTGGGKYAISKSNKWD